LAIRRARVKQILLSLCELFGINCLRVIWHTANVSIDAKPGSKWEAKKLGVQRNSLVETADDSESRALIDPVPAITRGNNSQVASTQLSSRRCFLAKAAFVRFADFRMGLSP
jgi:hypothetical protein